MATSTTPVSPRRAFVLPIVGEMWNQRDLLWQFTRRNIEQQHKGSYLGYLWVVLSPLFRMGLYTFVFGILMDRNFGVVENESNIQFALGIILGVTFFGLISEVLTMAPFAVHSQRNLVTKVVFPLEVLPSAMVFAAIYRALVGLAIFFTGVLIFGPALHWGFLWLIPLFVVTSILSLGLAWFLSALATYMRDVQHLMAVISMALFWSSGIFYAAHDVQEEPVAWAILKWNPLLLLIDQARACTLWNTPIVPWQIAYISGVSLLFCVFGWWFFRSVKGGFADVV